MAVYGKTTDTGSGSGPAGYAAYDPERTLAEQQRVNPLPARPPPGCSGPGARARGVVW
jgi:hypothetical protein